MDPEMMDLHQLASYLQRDLREVTKLASRGQLPGHKVSGEWRFAQAEINHWLETQIPSYTDQQLTVLETRTHGNAAREMLLSNVLTPSTMSVPLPAGTRSSVLRELVKLAEQSWNVYDADAVLTAIKQREEYASTALPSGVAIPHPRRPLPNALGEAVVAYGRTASGIPFGAPHGNLTDLFFLVCCRDQPTHLRILARLSRLMLRPGFLEELRQAENVSESFQVIEAAEQELTDI